jgi:hypothetical protein
VLEADSKSYAGTITDFTMPVPGGRLWQATGFTMAVPGGRLWQAWGTFGYQHVHFHPKNSDFLAEDCGGGLPFPPSMTHKHAVGTMSSNIVMA